MKRYLLFCMESYYPNGGWDDFVGSYDTVEEARTDARRDFWHIIDTETLKEVAYGNTRSA